ncbi:hypothetical protein AB0E08_08135 [Streptomyces sp. NPDC048281]|uniref:hypothetical protein n=1 Tax=Streptomyces sp. NPDC048281 TaxID=3154715 RepID=UPI00343C39B4
MHGDLNDYWNYILSGLDVVGLFALRAVGKKKATGWLWAMLTQAVWMVYSLSTHQWGFLTVAAVKFGVYTWNWTSWLREDKPKTHVELAYDLAKQVIPDADPIVQMHAASFLTRAIKAAELYPEKMKAAKST